MRVQLLVAYGCWWMLSMNGVVAAEADVARLAAKLDSHVFQEREQAERDLMQVGIAILDEEFEVDLPTREAADAEVDVFFAKLSENLEGALQQGLYDHLDNLDSPEAIFRVRRVRIATSRVSTERFSALRGRYPVPLPVKDAERVDGYTGGFRDSMPWFDASYQNGSTFTVTSIHILVRITHRDTGETMERVAVLGESERPIPPGGSAKWSVEVGITRSADHEFFWKTLSVRGLPAPAVR